MPDSLPLLSAMEAQKTSVHQLPSLLSPMEVATVHELAAACAATAGRDLLKYDGTWETTYLHTGGFFRRNAPELLDKLTRAVWAADASGGTMGQLKGRDPASVGVVRCLTVALRNPWPQTVSIDPTTLCVHDAEGCRVP